MEHKTEHIMENIMEHIMEHKTENIMEHIMKHKTEHIMEHKTEYIMEHIMKHKTEHVMEHTILGVIRLSNITVQKISRNFLLARTFRKFSTSTQPEAPHHRLFLKFPSISVKWSS
jgi:hypothetical protein